ncbi:hypothetical protein SLA2020_263420 [Shorea laevis]
MVKANWDAALDSQSQRMGVCMIVCDVTASVLATMCTSISFIIEPTIAEALALWKTVSSWHELGFQRLHLEGDALRLSKPFTTQMHVGAVLAN